MEKRSAARELAFLALFQLPQNPEKFASKLSKMDFHAICLSGIRTLADHARSNLNKAEAFFIKTERGLMEYQINHPLNDIHCNMMSTKVATVRAHPQKRFKRF